MRTTPALIASLLQSSPIIVGDSCAVTQSDSNTAQPMETSIGRSF